MTTDNKPFLLSAFDETGAGVRELVATDPQLSQIGGADTIKVCCTSLSNGHTYCGRDDDA